MFITIVRKTMAFILCLGIIIFVGLTLFPRQATRAKLLITQHTGTTNSVAYQGLLAQADLFDKKLVRVKALIIQDKTGIFLCNENLGTDNDFIGVDLDLTGLPSETQNWLAQVHNDNVTDLTQVRKSAAIFTGWFNGNVTPGCYIPKHRLTVIKIEQQGEITIGLKNHT